MKKLFPFLLVILLNIAGNAQTPNGFSYQAVLRNSTGQVLANQSASIKVSLTNSNGTSVHYSETHNVTSNAIGLVNVVIGSGQDIVGSIIEVPWSSLEIYLTVELKLDGSDSYTPMGSQKLQSVPYALFAVDGISVEWLGALANAPAAPTLNQAYYNTFEKKSFIWDGDSWEIIAIDGAEGPKGENGETGSQGDQGIAGINGISLQWQGSLNSEPVSPELNYAYYNIIQKKSFVWDGTSWEIMVEDGAVGPQGLQGLQGLQGVEGPIGPQGVQGPIGPIGPAGVGLNLRGNWSADSTYTEGDYVFDESNNDPLINSMWICQINVGPVLTHPKDDGSKWVEFEAPQGPEGPQGVQGPTGSQGPIGASGISIQWLGTLIADPGSPEQNQAYYNSVDKKSYIWDGDSWETLTQDGVPGPEGPVVAGTEGQILVHSGTAWAASSKITVNADTVGIGTNTPISKLIVQGENSALPEDPIFEVRNKDGKVVLGVYNEGVRIYVNDSSLTKGRKGGFAVGGLTNQTKVDEVEYFRVTPDSTRFWMRDLPTSKGRKGGFAVGGLTNQVKSNAYDLLFIAPDSARIYTNDTLTIKGRKGGFAVGGLTNQTKTSAGRYLDMTPENYFIGHEAGKSITSGLYNSFVGYQSGFSNSEGTGNILLGYQSGFSNTTGNYNSFLGYLSGNKNTVGAENTFLGSYSGRNNISGNNNTFLGFNAGFSNTSGSGNIFTGTGSGYSNTTGAENLFLGSQTGYNNSTGSFNVFMGFQTGINNLLGNNNIFIGNNAGFTNATGSSNVFLGNYAGYYDTASYNVFIGYQSGMYSQLGDKNTFVGNMAGRGNYNGTANVFIGNEAGFTNVTGLSNVFIGDQAGHSNLYGFNNVIIGRKAGFLGDSWHNQYNVFIGHESGYTNNIGKYNVFLGNQSGWSNNDGSSNVFLGNQAGYLNSAGSNNVFVGYNSGREAISNQNIFIGSESGFKTAVDTNIFVGYQAGRENTTGFGNVFIGNQVGFWNSNGVQNVFVGTKTGFFNTSGSGNTFLGYFSGYKNTTGGVNFIAGVFAGYNSNGTYSTIIGPFAGYNNLGGRNIFIGYQSGSGFTTGNDNVIIGSEVGGTSGSENCFVGFRSGNANASSQNSFYGSYSGHSNTSGTQNTYLGYSAGRASTTGSNNVFIGYQAGYNENNNNRLYIHNSSADLYNALIYGEFDNKILRVNGKLFAGFYGGAAGNINSFNIEVGGTAPSATNGEATIFFHDHGTIAHQFRYTNGTLYLESAGNGYGTSTTPYFYVGGGFAAAYNGGNVGIGTNNPSWKFHVVGQAYVSRDAFLAALSGYNVGIGTTSPTNKLSVVTNHASNHAAYFFNDGNENNRSGIKIQAGIDTGTGDIVYVDCLDGDGTWLGSIFSRNGVIQLAAKSAKLNSKALKISERNGLKLISNIKVVDYESNISKKTVTGFIGEELLKLYPEIVSYNEKDDEYSVSNDQLVPILTKAIQEQQSQIDALKAELEEIKALLKK